YMCKTCKAGTYANNNKCETCPAGSYCIDGVKHPCQAGTFSTSGASSCSACPDGYYVVAGTASCSPCPAGYYCKNNAKNECKDEYYQDATTQASCKPCSGSYTLTETCSLARNVSYTGGACSWRSPSIEDKTTKDISFGDTYNGYLTCSSGRLYTEKNLTRDDKATYDFVEISRTAKLSAKPDVDIFSLLTIPTAADKYQLGGFGGCSLKMTLTCDKTTGQLNGFKHVYPASQGNCGNAYSYSAYDSLGGSSVCVKKYSF
ncbi:hypothetical protein HDR60_05170, partial [bacterium]|nr:hypothetical protein [bacterium]